MIFRIYIIVVFCLLLSNINQAQTPFESWTSAECEIFTDGLGKPLYERCPQMIWTEATCCIYDYDGYCVGQSWDCSYWTTIYVNYYFEDTSADCGPGWQPANLTLSGSTSGSYCVNQTITLSAPNYYHSYIWQYTTGGGVWTSFDTTTIASKTFGIQDLFGANYSPHLFQGIQFRYEIGGCGTTSQYIGPFSFSPVKPVVTSAQGVMPSCTGFSDASIKVESIDRTIISGETIKYSVYNTSGTFLGKKSSTQQPSVGNPILIGAADIVGGLASGNYKILVESDTTLCGVVSYYDITIPNRTAVTFTNSTPVQPSCYGGSNGSITLTGGGGSGGYQYSKDNGSTFQASNILSGLTAQSYSVKIKDSNGCLSGGTSIAVGQPTDITISSASVTSDYFGSDIKCNNSTDGQITVSATGGTGSLSYSKDGTTYQASNVFNGLGANDYTITVKDVNNCTKQSAVVPVVAPAAITATVTPTGATCNGLSNGSIVVTSPVGGVGSFTYSIDGTNFQPGATFTNLAANNYTVTVRDANLCTTPYNRTVSQPSPIGVSSAPTTVTCFGGNDGSIQITATNTNGAVTYSLNGGAYQSSNIFTGLSASTYTVSVKDANGCLGSGNAPVSANPIITGPINATPITCPGGSDGALNLTPGGGVGPYTYLWSNGATTEDISGLSAATYTVIVKDTKNCTQTFNRPLTEPAPFSLTSTPSGISCFGGSDGSISLSVLGGNGGYTYLWSNGATTPSISGLTAGNYNVTIKDIKNCSSIGIFALGQPTQLVTNLSTQNVSCFGGNTGSITLNTIGGTTNYQYSINGGSTWQSSPMFSGLSAASYTVLTRDANNCIDADNTTITSPTDISVSLSGITNTTCNQNNGSITASASGGAGGYSFEWFDSGNTLIGTGNTISNLGAGVYRLDVKDQNSCLKQNSIPLSSSNGPSVTVQNITPASCSNTSDGSATIIITQGQAPYTILWPNNQTTETATNLAGGDYIVEVRDQTNCLALKTVNVGAPPALTIQTITEKDPNCNGSADGAIEVAAQGGNGTYSYTWNNGSTNNIINNLTAGTYSVTTKDIKNCQTIQQFTLTDPPVFTIDLGEDQKICEGQTVQKQSDVSGGTYEWIGPNNFVSTQQQVSISQPGVYSLKVTNANGCEASDSFELMFDTNLLKADFLMVREAYVGDTVMMIDISWPIPTNVSWQLDPGATIIDQSPDYSMVRYDEPGTYNTMLLAQLAQCASSFSQSIEVIANPNGKINSGRMSEGLIRMVSVYPNPAAEKMSLIVELNRPYHATIEMYQLNSNQRALVQSFNDASHYETDLKINHLQSGPYVIVVKSGDEIKSLKIIKL